MTRQVDSWYQDSFYALEPLRYHLNVLLEEVEHHNRLAEKLGYPPIRPDYIAAARKVSDKCEKHFVRPLPENKP